MKYSKHVKLQFPWVFVVMLGGFLSVPSDEWRYWLFFSLSIGCLVGGMQKAYIQGLRDGYETR